MTTETLSQSGQQMGRRNRSRLAWEDIHQPGAYVSEQTGKLYRLTENALVRGASPGFIVTGDSGPFVQVDQNPHVHVQKARLICNEEEISPTF